MSGEFKGFYVCRECGYRAWRTYTVADGATGPPASYCGQCGRPWQPADPALAEQKRGSKGRCGRCQRIPLSTLTAFVANAPPGIFASWCYDCIEQVNRGRPAILYGVSIDHDGYVIRREPAPAAAPTLWMPPTPELRAPQTPEEKVRAATRALALSGWADAVAAALALALAALVAVVPRPAADGAAPAVPLALLYSAGLARSYFVLRGVARLRRRESQADARRTALLAALPLGPCFLLSLPLALIARSLLGGSGVAELFGTAPSPAVAQAAEGEAGGRVAVRCPECGRRNKAAGEQIGKKVRCSGCKAVFVARAAGDA